MSSNLNSVSSFPTYSGHVEFNKACKRKKISKGAIVEIIDEKSVGVYEFKEYIQDRSSIFNNKSRFISLLNKNGPWYFFTSTQIFQLVAKNEREWSLLQGQTLQAALETFIPTDLLALVQAYLSV